MTPLSSKTIILFVIVIVSSLLAIGVRDGISQPPPVETPLVREGNFAMKLAPALNLGNPISEAEAENMLGSVGVAPRNGWIADYPVTPDIVGELSDSVAYAAQAKTISMDSKTALDALENVQKSTLVALTPAPAGPPPNSNMVGTPEEAEEGAPEYPDPAFIRGYYSEQGPPILTYYAPPVDYYYLYTWVPYPFWFGGFWFGGYFILNDFHRLHRDRDERGEHNHLVSNHFNDVNAHHVFRIDPLNRLNGRTFAGIGAPRATNFINTGVAGSQQRIFNTNRTASFRSGTNAVPAPSGTTRTVRQPAAERSRSVNPFHQSHVYSQPPGGGRTFVPRGSTPGVGKPAGAQRGLRSESVKPKGVGNVGAGKPTR